jgi:hypothetical protein
MRTRTSSRQGVLVVYSEWAIRDRSGTPQISRRPVEVYNDAGQVVASARDPLGDGPIHFELAPGHYVVASESLLRWRRVEVDVRGGRQTIVSELALEQAPLLREKRELRPRAIEQEKPAQISREPKAQ